jgi:hypothetical protein
MQQNLQQQVQDLLSHPLLVGPDGVPPGASELDVQAVEQIYGVRLPATLRDWFSAVNGAFCGTQQFVPLNDHSADYSDFIASLWLPVAADGCGNYYLVDLTGPDQGTYPVFFWDHETGYDSAADEITKGYAVASNIWIFSLLLLRKELRRLDAGRRNSGNHGDAWHWPFDRDRTLQHDPDLARVTSAPLPWC